MKLATMTVLIALGLLTAADPAQDGKQPKKEQFVIEKFDFDWFVAESGEAKLIVNKTHDTTRIIIREGGLAGDSLWLLPDDAVAVGTALGDVEKFYTAMRSGGSDASNDVDAGQYKVTFRFSKEHGFSVWIAKKERFMGSSISLEREAAKAFAPHLVKAKAMAAFIDAKLKF